MLRHDVLQPQVLQGHLRKDKLCQQKDSGFDDIDSRRLLLYLFATKFLEQFD